MKTAGFLAVVLVVGALATGCAPSSSQNAARPAVAEPVVSEGIRILKQPVYRAKGRADRLQMETVSSVAGGSVPLTLRRLTKALNRRGAVRDGKTREYRTTSLYFLIDDQDTVWAKSFVTLAEQDLAVKCDEITSCVISSGRPLDHPGKCPFWIVEPDKIVAGAEFPSDFNELSRPERFDLTVSQREENRASGFRCATADDPAVTPQMRLTVGRLTAAKE